MVLQDRQKLSARHLSQELCEALTPMSAPEPDKAAKQMTLTAMAPMILDATCSFSKRWPRTATIRIDIRPEVRPDIVMDAKQLKFGANAFDEIYCDPPHLFRNNDDLTFAKRYAANHRPISSNNIDPFTRYGYWHNRAEWLDFVVKSMAEFHRCLKPNGRLHYKLTETRDNRMKVKDLLAPGLFDIEVDKITKSRGVHKNNEVHWLTMRPKP